MACREGLCSGIEFKFSLKFNMNRIGFLKNFFGLGLLSMCGCRIDTNEAKPSAFEGNTNSQEKQNSIEGLRKELQRAWHRSETMTLKNVNQMPPDFFTFRYTNEAMTFAEQWRHCVMYTCGQLAGRAGLINPYEKHKTSDSNVERGCG